MTMFRSPDLNGWLHCSSIKLILKILKDSFIWLQSFFFFFLIIIKSLILYVIKIEEEGQLLFETLFL